MDKKWIVPAINIKEGAGIAKAGKPVQVDADRADQLIADKKATVHEEAAGTLEGVVDSQNNFTSLEELEREQLEEMAVDMEIEGFEDMDDEALISAIRNQEAVLPALEELEDDDLKELAKKLKIPGFGNMKRENLIEKIRAAEAKAGDQG